MMKMKRLFILLSILVAFNSCVMDENVSVNSITLDTSEKTLIIDEQYQINATVSPKDATNDKIIWQSSNSDVASVSEGLVTANAVGEAIITAVADDNGLKSTCKVVVISQFDEIPLDSLKLSVDSDSILPADNIILHELQSDTLFPTYFPTETTDREVEWLSTDKSVALVVNGVVTALRGGETEIIVRSVKDESINYACKVTVIPSAIPMTSFTLCTKELILTEREFDTLKVDIEPNNATERELIWKSSDNNVAIVNDGIVTALHAGEATISVQSVDGSLGAECTVKVLNEVNGVLLNYQSYSMDETESFKLKAITYPGLPENALVWKSTDKSIATVTSDGEVYAVAAGSCDITVSSSDGKFADTCSVTVTCSVTGIEIDMESVNMYIGDDMVLSATITPDNATNRNIRWSSIEESVVSVDTNGVIHANQVGYTYIYAISADGGYSSKCKVNVFNHVAGVTLDKSYLSMQPGDSENIQATVFPDDALLMDVEWSSSNPDAVTVDQFGKIYVKSVSKEDVIIIAKTIDGGYSSGCQIHIIRAVKGIELNESKKELMEKETFRLEATVLPEDADNKNVYWTSSDDKVASVDENGIVTANFTGTAIITATAQADTTKTAACTVTVTCPVGEVRINAEKVLTLKLNDKFPVNATVLPERAVNKNVIWEISDKQIATIYTSQDEDGILIDARNRGTFILKAISKENPEICDSCIVHVVAEPNGLSLDKYSLSLFEGEYEEINASLSPADAEAEITWTPSDASVISVSEEGKVTALEATAEPVFVRVSVVGYENLSEECMVIVKCHPSAVDIASQSVSIFRGDTYELSYKVLPERTTDKRVSFDSSDETVATVSSNGVVTALKAGTAIISVKTLDRSATDEDVVSECIVTVKDYVSGVTVSPSTIGSLYVGDSPVQLTAIVGPTDSDNKTVNWTSDNPTVARVDESGSVTPVGNGRAVITATTVGKNKEGQNLTAGVSVYVKQHVTGVLLNAHEKEIQAGGTFTLVGTVIPSVDVDNEIEWSSSDNSVATVDQNGIVKGVKSGTSTITVKTKDGSFTDECVVTVKSATILVSSISFKNDRTQMELELTETGKLTTIIYPENAANKKLEWRNSNPSVATVDDDGYVTPVSAGTTVITAVATDGSGCSASCTVTVKGPGVVHVSSVSLSPNIITDLEIGQDKAKKITATVKPDNAANKTLNWSCSDPEALSFEPTDGGVNVIGKKSGTYTVSAISTDGSGAKGTCSVTVIKQRVAVNDIIISQKEAEMYVGTTLQLSAYVMPLDATDTSIVWSTNKGAPFSVSPNGLVTASGAGNGKVFVASVDNPDYEEYCNITVKNIAVTGVNFENTALSMVVGSEKELKYTISPANATVRGVSWKTDNNNVVTVNYDGKIKAVGKGRATITLTTDDGSYKAYCHVTVTSDNPEGGQSEGAGFEDWN